MNFRNDESMKLMAGHEKKRERKLILCSRGSGKPIRQNKVTPRFSTWRLNFIFCLINENVPDFREQNFSVKTQSMC